MIQLFRQLNSLFNRRERWQLAILTVALLARAGIEIVGASSIAPFMSLVADASVAESNPWLKWAYNELGFTSTTGFLTAAGIAVVALLAISNAVSAAVTWGMLRFSWGTHHRLSMRLVKGYLSQPYSFFVQRNSASLNKTLLLEVQSAINGALMPVLTLVSRLLIVIALATLLFILDPVLAMVILCVLGGAYATLYSLVRNKQRRLGIERVKANQRRFKVTGEAFGGIKDVKVLQREDAFARRYAGPSWTFSRATASNAAIAQLPRFLFETIAFGGIVIIVLYYLRAGGGVAHILPIISLYAYVGYRLMPELQQLFGAFAQIRFNKAALDDLTRDLNRVAGSSRNTSKDVPQLPFQKAITFNDVTFRYPGAAANALESVSLEIGHNQSVGLVGPSGSGKTTLVDLLLGLYEPDEGQILIDGLPMGPGNLSAWQRQIGYVPQHIFLCDDSISSNIAFGIPSLEVDHQRVEQAARTAHLHDFVQTLPGGYETVVGERGVRLSGGQRQRIGIARAVYHNPSVLIMDEATSALDGETETAVMDAVHELGGKKTIIMIAHRLTTLRGCDSVVVVDTARIRRQGTYKQLVDAADNAVRRDPTPQIIPLS
ncbi:MAG: ABC transporter ATP-binding protein/permease [Pirellulales bacterium]|nr:ABC transporter ATP-binding protein/permease [Pirellulales bacterium]